MTVWLAVVSALWLGIQTSISPVLATNIAAVAFWAHVSSPRRVCQRHGLCGRANCIRGFECIDFVILKDRSLPAHVVQYCFKSTA